MRTPLSDGYRTVAGLVLDLVKQIHAMNGQVTHEVVDSSIRVLHEGVVLIDEIDVHLHVEWQRRIGFWLKEHFPHIQFLVSTHSPFICQAADPGGLVRMAPSWQEGPSAAIVEGEVFNRVVNGSTDEALLTDLFGLETTLSDRAIADRESLARLEAAAIEGAVDPSQLERMKLLGKRIPSSQVSAVDTALRMVE